MGHKVHPKIFRIGRSTNWDSKWFATKDKLSNFLRQDVLVRDFLLKKLKKAAIDKIETDRQAKKMKINIITARPGVIIGRGGEEVEKIKTELKKKFFKNNCDMELSVQEVKIPFLSARVVMENIAAELEKRVPYRRVMKQTIEQVKKAGGKGVKINLSGRLDGVEIARREKLAWGKIPLHTLRADIDYVQGIAQTTYGVIGVKVWIYKGEFFQKNKKI